MKWIITAVVLSSGFCWGQTRYALPLIKAQPELTVPTMVARNGIIYVAYRSFDWLHRSEQLQVISYDLISRKGLLHQTISVPKLSGARASEKLALSRDGETLAYVETGSPVLVLLISAKSLSEMRRLQSLPFHEDNDRYEAGPSHFYGFDDEGNLCFRSSTRTKPRFLCVNSSDFKVVADTEASALKQRIWRVLNWNPTTKRLWLENDDKQYWESGEPTGEELPSIVPELDQGAYGLGNNDLLAFYAMVSKGTVVLYRSHRNQALELPCSPSPYGISNDHSYAAAVCITQPGGLPEAGGDRVLTSDFLLIRSDGPSVIWRQKMSRLGAGDRNYYRWASAVIEPSAGNVWVVAPTRSAELALYGVAVHE
jgi:hypothetical protein